MSRLNSLLTQFMNEHAVIVPGHRCRVADFVDLFERAVRPDTNWTRREIVAGIDQLIASEWLGVVRGRTSDNYISLGNISLNTHQFENRGDRLVKVAI